MRNFIIFLTGLLLIAQVHQLFGFPITGTHQYFGKTKRSNENLLPNENFSLVTPEKLIKLKEFADNVQDPKLDELYHAVNLYFELARRNNEYLLWKYDTNQQGLVLLVKQNLNGILYYG